MAAPAGRSALRGARCARTLATRAADGGSAASEVGGVERFSPAGFVDVAQLAEGELGADEGGGEVAVLEAGLGGGEGVEEDPVVVEGERDGFVDDVGDGPEAGVGASEPATRSGTSGPTAR
jgi:hypothetical protein